MTETIFKKKLLKLLSTYKNIYVRKISDRWCAGLPDLYVCYQDRSIWIELKVVPNLATPLQKKEIERIHLAGGQAIIFWVSPAGQSFLRSRSRSVYSSLEEMVKEVLEE